MKHVALAAAAAIIVVGSRGRAAESGTITFEDIAAKAGV